MKNLKKRAKNDRMRGGKRLFFYAESGKIYSMLGA